MTLYNFNSILMEGYLKKYKNFVSGYKKCYVKLEDTSLIILKGNKDSDQKVALNLRNCKVEINPSQSRDFILTIIVSDANHTTTNH